MRISRGILSKRRPIRKKNITNFLVAHPLTRYTALWYMRVRGGVRQEMCPNSDFPRVGTRMGKNEFSQIRHHLEKSQSQLARLLGTSPKTIQSFEQGWRNIPLHTERQLLFLLALKRSRGKRNQSCWLIQNCPTKIKQDCPAWEFQAGQFCWFINGTICQGKLQETWRTKMKICGRCEVFQSMFSLKSQRVV